MVLGGIIVRLGDSLDDRMKIKAWGDLDKGDVEDFGRHADMGLEGLD